jgi:hypothetical protein
MKNGFAIYSLGNKEPVAKSRTMTVQQAEQLNAIRYRVYCGGKLLDAFNRRAEWPFIWGERGCRIARKGRVYEVQNVRTLHFARLVKIYVKRA